MQRKEFIHGRKVGSSDFSPRDLGSDPLLRSQVSSYHNANEAGIIFVSVEDPYSCLTRSISKCEYSAIGFYAPSTSTGVLKIIVTLVDLFGVEKPSWLSSGCTLDRLIKNPLVTRLAIKPLRLNSTDPHKIRAAQSKFRACICRGTEMVKKPSLEETIFSLFGYNCNRSSRGDDQQQPCITGVDLVNQVISLYGELDKIQPGSSINLSTLDELQKIRDYPDQLSVIGMMGLPFSCNGSDIVDISTYIVDTNLFGDLTEITLPKHDPLVVESEKRRILNLYRPYLTKGLSTFVDLLMSHPDFFLCVTQRLKEGKKLAESSEKILTETLLGFANTSEEILTFLQTLSQTGKFKHDELTKLKENLTKEYFTSCLYLDKEPKVDIYHPQRHHEDYISTSGDLQELKLWTQHLLHEMSSTETSCHPVHVDVSHLVAIVNRLTNETLSVPEVKKKPALLLNDQCNIIPIASKLSSGKVIYLDRYHPNLDPLTSHDLIEVSHHLNSLDESYDSLREAVANQLISLHDVSEI